MNIVTYISHTSSAFSIIITCNHDVISLQGSEYVIYLNHRRSVLYVDIVRIVLYAFSISIQMQNTHIETYN